MAWSCPKDAPMTGESNLLWNGPQLERGKEAKNHLKELEAELGPTRGKAQAKDQNRVD